MDILNINEQAVKTCTGQGNHGNVVAVERRSQALAYLDDGTMIVIERGKI